MKHKWNKKRLIHLITWGITAITLVLWLPTIIAGIHIGTKIFKFKLIKEASSIGIIGGADGPTAIYMTSNTLPLGLSQGSFLLFMLGITIVLWVIKMRISKKEREKNE